MSRRATPSALVSETAPVKRNSLLTLTSRSKSAAFLMLGALASVSALPVSAQTANPPPATNTPSNIVNYGTLTGAFSDGIAPILGQVMPYAVVLMAIWFGPGLFHRLLQRFSH